MASAATPEDSITSTSHDTSTDGCGEDDPNAKRLKTETHFTFSETPTFKEIHDLHQHFIKERNWDQFHPPRNVLLALVGEVGELAEIFQWKGEVKEGLPDWSPEDKKHVGQELSDVLFHLLDLAARCHIDLPLAAIDKMTLNAKKYPAAQVYGSAKKYTEYK